jgi:hypothetical protein
LNLDDYEIFTDPATDEAYLSRSNDPSGQRIVILPEDWRQGSGQYLSEEDALNNNLEVYIDAKSKRKYILDEANDKKFYLVSEESLSKRKKKIRL